jgi:hypothetical protein
VPVNAENTYLLFKERRPFKLKKEYPSEQWQIISFRLKPLKTPVSFRWTVPLNAVRDSGFPEVLQAVLHIHEKHLVNILKNHVMILIAKQKSW